MNYTVVGSVFNGDNTMANVVSVETVGVIKHLGRTNWVENMAREL